MAKTIAEQIKLLKRGTVEIFSEDELTKKLTDAVKTGRQLRIKLGLDPTSPDIHLGHTVVLRKMRQFQDLGHKAVLIIGDYTARIGDPTGQNATRPMLSPEQIEENARTYLAQAGKILDTSKDKLEVRHNSEWLETMTLMELIQLAAKKTVAQMLQRDSFKLRLQNDIDVYTHEFIYPLMQGYDSVAVKSDVELGGTDQTFNNLVGRDIQRAYGQQPQIVITVPILVGLDGKEKMSKSKGNYIGVTDQPNDMFGKVMSISDEMMENYFTLLTDLPAEKITELVKADKTHPKEAKVLLAKTIMVQLYDEKTADAAAAEFDKVFAQGQLPDDIPEVKMPAEPIMASKLLVTCKLVPSGSEAKRMIKQGAVEIDKKKVDDPNTMITPADGMIIQVGKRKFAKLKIN
ncbi:MAG: tyrosine--tRNA ligase [Phycisphaerae bacterium]|nr:tyrosine--tRNA ligase [Phycisphaerae bacterium]MDD5381149.1 tyrosine--tRNA ligase [Phycisphaerae bacterium]